eukprot:5236126-Pyramimonas_sp.AAC.1
MEIPLGHDPRARCAQVDEMAGRELCVQGRPWNPLRATIRVRGAPKRVGRRCKVSPWFRTCSSL